MGVSNLNKFNKYAREYGVKDYQLIMGADKSGRNVKGILISGYTFDKLSQYGLDGDDLIIELMQNIACMGVAEAYKLHVAGRKSVAKVKANEAHGRTNDERYSYLLEQMMTYAKRFKNIQFVGQTMESVFDQMIEQANITPEQWVKGMQDWHGVKAKAKVLNDLKNGAMHIVYDDIKGCEVAVCDVAFREHIQEYCKQNHLNEPNEEQKTKMIKVYLKGLGV